MKFIEKIGYKSSARVRARLENIERYPFHMHDDSIEIICVLDGNVTISDAAATYRLGYGDIHVFNLGDPHRIQSEEDNIILTVHIDYTHYHRIFPDIVDPPYFICDENSQGYSSDLRLLRFRMADLFTSYSESASDMRTEQKAIDFFDLLVSSFQNYTYIESDTQPALIVHSQTPPRQDTHLERMHRVVDHVYDHFNEKITLAGVAETEYISPSHLSRYIHETLGLTFSQVVSLARCEEASRLLSSTSKTVDQIAAEVGFANRKHLAVQFRRWYLKTPTEYRREIIKDLNAETTVVFRSFDYTYALKLLDMYLDEY